jgi:hypothetical protein
MSLAATYRSTNCRAAARERAVRENLVFRSSITITNTRPSNGVRFETTSG